MTIKLLKKLGFVFLTIALIVSISLCFGFTAYSMNVNNSGKNEINYVKSLEKEYLKNVREFLNSKGLTNAGIMLTKTTDSTGRRDYTLSINHRLLDAEHMEELQKDLLTQELMNMDFPIDDATICVMTTA